MTRQPQWVYGTRWLDPPNVLRHVQKAAGNRLIAGHKLNMDWFLTDDDTGCERKYFITVMTHRAPMTAFSFTVKGTEVDPAYWIVDRFSDFGPEHSIEYRVSENTTACTVDDCPDRGTHPPGLHDEFVAWHDNAPPRF